MEKFLINEELLFDKAHRGRSGAGGELYSVTEYRAFLEIIRESVATTKGGGTAFVDLGSGTGSALLSIAGLPEFEGSSFIGVELDVVFFQESTTRLQRARGRDLIPKGNRVEFLNANITLLTAAWLDEELSGGADQVVLFGFDYLMPAVVIQHEWAQLFAKYEATNIIWITTQNPAKYPFKEIITPKLLNAQLIAGDIRYRERLENGYPENVRPPINKEDIDLSAAGGAGGQVNEDAFEKDNFIVFDEDDQEVNTKEYMGPEYYDRFMNDKHVMRFMKASPRLALGILREIKNGYILQSVAPLPGDEEGMKRAVEMNRFLVWVYEKNKGRVLEINTFIQTQLP